MTSLHDADASAAGNSADATVLLAASAVPAFVADAEGRITFVNAALLAMSGLARGDLIGEKVSRLIDRRGERVEVSRLDEARHSGLPYEAEILCARSDGTSYWGRWYLAPHAGGHVGQIVDVSRGVEAQNALALSQKREALGLLTNSVAHEFNNFLQILIGYIDGLKRRLGDRPEPFIQRALTRSTEAAERAAVLTRQLLAYSRRIAPEVRPIDLDALLATVGESLSAQLPARIRLDLKPAGNLPAAMCNPLQVELALRYLVANAVEAASGDGCIEIATFAIAPGDPSLQRPSEGAVGISVRDDGHGMSPEMATRALVPFATSREAGRGVGLAIVHGLMKRQNGTVGLDSRSGGGTTVRLVFPAAG